MKCQENFQEKSLMVRGAYLSGSNLTIEHKSMIRDFSDIWKISLIDNIYLDVQKEIGYAFIVSSDENRKHYATMCAVWLHGEKHFLGERLHHNPSTVEVVCDMESNHLGERFRLFYILEYPERMSMREDILSQRKNAAYAFLKRAGEIGDKNYLNYFSSNFEEAVA